MKIVDFRKPIESYKYPLADGPINAPNANVDVQRPDIRPYVSIVSGKPSFLDIYNIFFIKRITIIT